MHAKFFTKQEIPNPIIKISVEDIGHFPYAPLGRATLTPAMYWITVNKTISPKELLHDPLICDNCGQTCAMHWVKSVKTLPPFVLLP